MFNIVTNGMMELRKSSFRIYLILHFFLCTILLETQVTFSSPVSYPHNVNIQPELTNQIIEEHFDDCFVIKTRNQTDTLFTKTEMKIPVIQINYNAPDHARVRTLLAQPTRYSLFVKHNQQCIVYYMSLAGYTPEQFPEILETLQIRALQTTATHSYLMISESDTYEIGRAFILSPELKNFQHRMFVQLIVDEDIPCIQFQFQIHVFCYFCAAGSPDTFAEYTYETVQDVTGRNAIFPDVTENFMGATMRVVAPPAPPLVLILPSKSDPGKNEIHGQHAPILKSIAEHLNFTYSLHKSPLTGIKFPNGTWNGVMGEILYDRADIGLSVATSYDRYQIVDVTVSVFYAFLVLVSTKPTPTFEWQAIFYPFKMSSWIAFTISTILTYFLSKWIHNSSVKYEIPLVMQGSTKLAILNKMKAEFMSNYKAFYITVGNLLEQGPPFETNTIPSRIFITFWMFFAMIITTAYRSKLFTFLTFPAVKVPPSSFLELIGSSYKWGMKHIGGIAFVFITKSPLQYIRNIGEKMTVYNDKYSCLDRTFRDRFTCIIYRAYIDYMMEIRYWKLRHQFHISDFVSPPVGSAWVFPKYAPWLPKFDKASFSIYEMGLADKYLNDYQVSIAKVIRAKAQTSNSTQEVFDLNINFKSEDPGPKPLVMTNLYAAFFMLIFGVIVAGILLAFEIARRKKYKKQLELKRRILRVTLRRAFRRKRKEQAVGRGQPLSFQQVVKIIGPNTKEILETEYVSKYA